MVFYRLRKFKTHMNLSELMVTTVMTSYLLFPLQGFISSLKSRQRKRYKMSIIIISRRGVLVFFFSSCFFLGLHPQYIEVPRLGAELELQLPA